VFVSAYVLVWTVFSAVAALVQSVLHARGLLAPTMTAESPLLAGSLLVVAGVFQWTPLKHACLTVCRSPLSFIMSRWREGARGAFVMGVRHALYCLGCCWALMTLLFVGGVMNLVWVAAIAVAVLVEKVVPGGDAIGRVAGLALIVAGVWVATRVG
jgi:predicted metal-binding membrane protein